MNEEDFILEKTLEIAEKRGYNDAYLFLEKEKNNLKEEYPQVLYFLTCLAAGNGNEELAYRWLEYAILEKNYWYRTECLEDEDLEGMAGASHFLELKDISNRRYELAAKSANTFLTWRNKEKENILLTAHGNGQNADISIKSWKPLGLENLQIEAVQSGTVDSFGRFRWNYDEKDYKQFSDAARKIALYDYQKIFWGGFSAGCDMILRTILYSDQKCDGIVLQSPWIPSFEENPDDILEVIYKRKIPIFLFCGTEDQNCRDNAANLYEKLKEAGVEVQLHWLNGLRHQFPNHLGKIYQDIFL